MQPFLAVYVLFATSQGAFQNTWGHYTFARFKNDGSQNNVYKTGKYNTT